MVGYGYRVGEGVFGEVGLWMINTGVRILEYSAFSAAGKLGEFFETVCWCRKRGISVVDLHLS